jgi:hypothetical protein
MALEAVRNVAFGVHQQIPWQADNAFIRSTTSRGRQIGSLAGHINANDSEITIVKFPNVRTPPTTDGVGSVSVRVRADALNEIHNQYLTIAK